MNTLLNFFCKLSVKLAATFFFVLASMLASSFPATDVGLTSDNNYVVCLITKDIMSMSEWQVQEHTFVADFCFSLRLGENCFLLTFVFARF